MLCVFVWQCELVEVGKTFNTFGYGFAFNYDSTNFIGRYQRVGCWLVGAHAAAHCRAWCRWCQSGVWLAPGRGAGLASAAACLVEATRSACLDRFKCYPLALVDELDVILLRIGLAVAGLLRRHRAR